MFALEVALQAATLLHYLRHLAGFDPCSRYQDELHFCEHAASPLYTSVVTCTSPKQPKKQLWRKQSLPQRCSFVSRSRLSTSLPPSHLVYILVQLLQAMRLLGRTLCSCHKPGQLSLRSSTHHCGGRRVETCTCEAEAPRRAFWTHFMHRLTPSGAKAAGLRLVAV